MTFEDVLLEAIDEGLSLLGDLGKQAVYLHLKNKYNLSKREIPYRVEDFTEALEDTFQAGAKLLEIKIMKVLFTKVGPGHIHVATPESLGFISYVYALRNKGIVSSSSIAFCQQ